MLENTNTEEQVYVTEGKSFWETFKDNIAKANAVTDTDETEYNKVNAPLEANADRDIKAQYIQEKSTIGWNKGLITMADYLPFAYSEEEIQSWRNEIQSLENQNIELYNQHKDTIYGTTYGVGMIAEGLSNPLDMAINLGIGVATGGSGLLVRAGGQALGNVASIMAQNQTVYERSSTPTELAVGVAAGILPDVVGDYIGRRINFNSVAQAGDANVNIRGMVNSADDAGLYPGATELALQTRTGTPIYRVGNPTEVPTVSIDPNAPKLPTNSIQVDAAAANPAKINSSTINSSNRTYLQRREATYNIGKKTYDIEYVSFFDSHETFDIVGDTIKNNMDEFYARSAYNSGAAGYVDLANARDTFKSYYIDYEKQTVLIADEYANILGSKPQQYANSVGYTNKDLADMYVTGLTDNISDPGQKAFWDNVLRDRQILSGSYGKFTIDDVPNGVELVARYSDFLDTNGKINFSKISAWNKANPGKDGISELQRSTDWDTIIKLNTELTPGRGGHNIPGDAIARLEFITNKKELVGDAGRYFETSIKDYYDAPVSGAKLVPENAVEFENIYGPMFNDGTFPSWTKNLSNQEKVDFVFNLHNKIQRSNDFNTGNESYIPFQELGYDFDSIDGMIKFFGRNDKQYFKNNGEIIRSVFEDQAKDISMLDTFGTTSPGRLRNRASKMTHSSEVTRATGIKVPSDSDKAAAQSMANEFNVMMENTFFQKPVSELDRPLRIADGVRSWISRGVMYFHGVQEFATNPAIASMRAGKYGSNPVSALSYGTLRVMKKWAKQMTGQQLPNADYVIAKLSKSQRLSEPSIVGAADQVGYALNMASDINLNNYGEIFATSYIHKLKGNLVDVDPELRRVLKINGIDTQTKFDQFIQYANKHISDNGNYIDSKSLLDMSGQEMPDALRGIFNFISDDVGNVKSNSIFRHQAVGEISKWTGMFRGFVRALNLDMLDTTMKYTTREGLKKTRFSSGGIASTFNAKNIGNIGTIIGLGYAGSKGSDFLNDLAYGDRDFSERWALAKARFTNIPVMMNEGKYLDMFTGFVRQASKGLGLDVAGFLSAEGPKGILLKGEQKFKSWSEDEVIEADEVLIGGFDLIASTIVSKRARDFVVASHDTFNRNWDDSKSIYGFTPEQNQRYYQSVFDKRVTINEYLDSLQSLDNRSTHAAAQADYIEEKPDSFDKLPDKAKEHFEVTSKVAGLTKIEQDAAKAGFAVIWSEAQLESDKVQKKIVLDNGIKEEFGVTVSDVDNYVSKTNEEFNSISDKRKLLYQTMLEYTGTNDSFEERDKFINSLGKANSENVKEIMKKFYNVNIDEFNTYGKQNVDTNRASRKSLPFVAPPKSKERKESKVTFLNEDGTTRTDIPDEIAGGTKAYIHDSDVRKANKILQPKERYKPETKEAISERINAIEGVTFVQDNELSMTGTDGWFDPNTNQIGIDLNKWDVEKLSYIAEHEINHFEQSKSKVKGIGNMSLYKGEGGMYEYITRLEELDSLFAGFGDDSAAVKAYISEYQDKSDIFENYPVDVLATVVKEYREIRSQSPRIKEAHEKMTEVLNKYRK